MYYSIWLDGKRVHRVENTRPETFRNVKVFSGDPHYYPADATYKNLVWRSSWDQCQSLACPLIEVTGAPLHEAGGEYEVVGERVAWAGHRPLYKHLDRER